MPNVLALAPISIPRSGRTISFATSVFLLVDLQRSLYTLQNISVCLLSARCERQRVDKNAHMAVPAALFMGPAILAC